MINSPKSFEMDTKAINLDYKTILLPFQSKNVMVALKNDSKK